jgi:acetyltransferase
MTYPTQTADQLREVVANTKKPVLACWMGGPDVVAGVDILNRANIPTFEFPDMATRIFNYMWRYSYYLRAIYETPALPVASPAEATNLQRASELLEKIRKEGRTILTEFESKQVFAAYGIPTVETHLATTAEQAASIAGRIGYPVVLKLNSTTITHKSDVQGVQLNLRDEDQVRAAFATIEEAVTRIAGAEHFQGVTVQPMVKLEGYELIIGSSQDIQFGPVLLFGTGGTLVEVFKDRALGLPPLNTTLARRMMQQTRIFEALRGVRGRKAVDLEALDRLLVRFSQLVVEQPRIKEIDINPLLASPEQIIALDARIVLHDPALADNELPHPAIRPYPTQYIGSFTLQAAQPENGNKNGSAAGTTVEIRPIKPEDEPLMTEFTMSLSSDNLYLRYFHAVSASALISHEQLARLTFVDYNREMALVAIRSDPKNSRPQIIAHGQLTKLHGSNEAEFAIQVRDAFQGTGLGTELLNRLLDIARNEGIERVVAEIMPANIGMRRICEKLGFTITRLPDSQNLAAEIELEPTKEVVENAESVPPQS